MYAHPSSHLVNVVFVHFPSQNVARLQVKRRRLVGMLRVDMRAIMPPVPLLVHLDDDAKEH